MGTGAGGWPRVVAIGGMEEGRGEGPELWGDGVRGEGD